MALADLIPARASMKVNGTHGQKIRSYALNCFMGDPAGSLELPFRPSADCRFYLKTADVAMDSPGNRFVLADVNPANLCAPAFGVDMDQDIFFHCLHGGGSDCLCGPSRRNPQVVGPENPENGVQRTDHWP